MNLPVPRAIQLARPLMRLLERVSPGVGGRIATALFFKVPPVPPVAKRVRGFTGGSEVTAEVDGHIVRGREFGADDAPLIYLIHGWGGWWQQLGAYVDPLVGKGFRVIAIDALVHGESDSGHWGEGRSTVLELAQSLQAMVAAHGEPYAVVAHSAGGMATTWACTQGMRPARVVLIAPSGGPGELVEWMSGRLAMGPRTAAGMVRRIERTADVRLAEFEMDTMVTSLEDAPAALLVHDRDDPETLATSTERIAGLWPGAELRLTDGLGHHHVIWDDGNVAAGVEFLSADPHPRGTDE